MNAGDTVWILCTNVLLHIETAASRQVVVTLYNDTMSLMNVDV